jgi:hypothetical protein
MKFTLVLASFVLFVAFASAEEKDVVRNELTMLEDLIEATQQNLDSQIKLRDLVKHYQDVQAKFLQNEEDNELLYQMVKAAHTILELIKEKQLTQSFDPAFLSELIVVSKPVAKLGIPKP